MSDKEPEPATRAVDAASTPERLPSVVQPPLTHRPSCATEDDEPMGGDPPCWAHLFEEDEESPPER